MWWREEQQRSRTNWTTSHEIFESIDGRTAKRKRERGICRLLCGFTSDDVLRSFAVSEVYIRRGEENLSKHKRMQYARNLQLEKLIAQNSWATMEEMGKVIPYHTSTYQSYTISYINLPKLYYIIHQLTKVIPYHTSTYQGYTISYINLPRLYHIIHQLTHIIHQLTKVILYHTSTYQSYTISYINLPKLYHIIHYQGFLKICQEGNTSPTKSQIAFATRFIVTFSLFTCYMYQTNELPVPNCENV